MARGVRSTHAKLQHVSLPGKHVSFNIHKGALHRALGVPPGKKIPKSKLAQGAKSKNAHVRRMVASAKGLKAMKH